ncbi:hypothetical protein BU16DRAFT_530703 [Lophium mytilinum]|uniref:Pentacotripeptide-repeat region of PRORP domain-containing protein n=1 Tax=Lophium mytilinum TaxID=390894 RepID=A0A6A6QGA9_9PEZI|nr:hypothetical protein BU16DRAFT_530703 [Lophium mytilinum]
MPRCLLANARCFASADLPVLPFLAPRLFVPSAPWRYECGKRWNTGGSGSTERGEKGRKAGMKEKVTREEGKAMVKGLGKRRAKVDRELNTNARQGRLRGPRQLSNSQKKARSSFPNAPLYSEISTFFRSQLRTRKHAALSASRKSYIPSKSATKRRLEESNEDREQYDTGRFFQKILNSWIPRSKDSNTRPPRRRRKAPIHPDVPRSPSYTNLPPSDLKDITNDAGVRLKSRRQFLRSLPAGITKVSFTDGTYPLESWTKGFAVLNSYQIGFARHESRRTLELDPQCARWAKWFCQGGRSPHIQKMVWLRLRRRRQFEIWPAILLWLLQHNVYKAFDFLKISYTPPFPPSFIAVDALEYIASFLRNRTNKSRQMNRGSYQQKIEEYNVDVLSTFLAYLRQDRPPFIETISQRLVSLVMKSCSDEELPNLYKDLVSHGVKLNPKTVLAFTARFVDLNAHELGLETLGKAVQLGHNPLEHGFIQLSSAVLRCSASDGKSYHATAGIVARLLELGVCLDTQLYNIIIHNAVEARDYQTAWRIYDLLESGEAGLKPDGYTLGILLWGLKHDENPSKHRDFADFCAERAYEWRDSWLATEYLHYIYVCSQGDDTQDIIRLLRLKYSYFFDLQPLVDLKIYPRGLSPRSNCMPPSLPALFVIITSYLQSSQQLNDVSIHNLYTLFRTFVCAGHPIIAPLAETTHTHNAFLLAFCERPTLIKHAPMIIRDMAAELPKSAVHAAEQRPLKQAAPNAITWNIFSHGFVKAGQMAAAEKVVELMRKRNIQPTEITWGTLLNGYAAAQNVGKVAEVYGKMKRMPAELRAKAPELEAGYTMRALGKITNRAELIRALRDDMEKAGHEEGLEDEWSSASLMFPPTRRGERGGRDAAAGDVPGPEYSGRYREIHDAVSGWVKT